MLFHVAVSNDYPRAYMLSLCRKISSTSSLMAGNNEKINPKQHSHHKPVFSYLFVISIHLSSVTLTPNKMAMLNAFIRLGFSEAAAGNIVEQGFGTPEDLEQLTSEEVVGLCKSLRSPGGLIPNPIAVVDGDGNAPVGVPLFVRDPGENVGAMPEKSLKQAIYLVRHRIRIGRVCTPANITLRNVRRLFQLKRDEESYVEPAKPAKILKTTPKKLRETMEDLDSYFVKCLGTTKIPIAYVTRADPDVLAPVDDPSGNYASSTDEMIRRAPHGGPTYNTDNSTVWDMMMHVFHGTDAYPWIKQFARPRNGRGAYTALRAHYFGQSQEDNELNEAENSLTNTFYTGEKRNFTFETYAGIHRTAHNIFNECRDAPFEERDKVRRLLENIRCLECKAAITLIHADQRLRNDFDAAVDLIKTSLSQSKVTKEEKRGVGSLTQQDLHGGRGRGGRGGSGRGRGRFGGRGGRGGGRGGRGFGRGRGRGPGARRDISDRFYTDDEWYAMSWDDKQRVLALRGERTGGRNDDRNVSAATTTTEPNHSTAPAPDNRTHPALSRGNQRT
jgi:hypothetical protein